MLRFLVTLLALSSTVAAQLDSLPRVGVGVIKKELSLAQAIEGALRRNLEIQIERTEISTAVEAEKGAHGFLDPRFRWSPQIENRSLPTSSALFGVDGKLVEKYLTQNFYLDQRLPWWGSYLNIGFENSRQSTSNPFTALSPFTAVRLGASLTIPLWRNRDSDQERANLRIATNQLEISETALELKIIDVVARVEEAYWNVVATRQNVEVTSEAVHLAREQLARTRRMIDSGTLPPVEMAAAEAELERRVDTWYQSIGLVTQAENALKVLITENREELVWNDEIVPTDLRTAETPAEDLHTAVDVALKRRPELRQIANQVGTNAIQKELAQSQTKPGLNLVAGYYSSGLAGSVTEAQNPFSKLTQVQFDRVNELSAHHGLEPLPSLSLGGVPADLVGRYGTAIGDVFESRFPTAYVGFQVDWTVRNRAAESQLAQSAVADRRLALERTRVEQGIEAQVRNALQAIQTNRQRIAAAEASERAAKEKLDSEIRLFQSGESTNFLVLTRQNELSDSRQRAVVARLDFNKAVALLRQAIGTTLETYNITLH